MTRDEFNQFSMDSVKTILGQKPNVLYIDIGAYTGRYPLALAFQFPKVTFHLVEAEVKNYRELLRRAERLPNVHVYLKAIGAVNGMVRFYVVNNKKSEGSSQANSLHRAFFSNKKWVGDVEEQVVPCMTLDSFCKSIDITEVCGLKINCEGGEYEIFSSDEITILKSCQLLSLQLHGKCKKYITPEFEKKRSTIVTILSDLGMNLVAKQTKGIKVDHVRQIWRR